MKKFIVFTQYEENYGAMEGGSDCWKKKGGIEHEVEAPTKKAAIAAVEPKMYNNKIARETIIEVWEA